MRALYVGIYLSTYAYAQASLYAEGEAGEGKSEGTNKGESDGAQ